MHPQFVFRQLQAHQKAMVHRWLEAPHLSEWIHGVGLQNTLKGIEAFLAGQTETIYWLGFFGSNLTPFAFLITAPKEKEGITLDVFICDVAYLGKGLAVPMIRTFLQTHFGHVDKVFIDPEKTNTRAIHVYKKIGFKITHEFIASWHPVPHYQMELEMKNLNA